MQLSCMRVISTDWQVVSEQQQLISVLRVSGQNLPNYHNPQLSTLE